jgi:hypothetical protein
MDTKALIAEAKARFNHNFSKAQLKDKYDSKLIIADQGGLWRADQKTISFLHSMQSELNVILIDTFDNPVLVNRVELLTKLKDTYDTVMRDWYNEWSKLEKQR